MGLGFLSPIFLAGLLAIGVPLVLHLFRRRADPVLPFSAVRLLRQAPVEQARRRRIRDLVLLALRVAAVALLALSFARPYVTAPAATSAVPLTVIAIDTSYSMSTPSQVARAKALATAALDEVPAGGAAALVRFDEQAEVAAGPTFDRGAVGRAIAATTPGLRATRYASAIATASDLAAGRRARLVIVSDLQQRGWNRRGGITLPATVTLDVKDAGAATGNLGVVRLARTPGGVSAAVRSTWATPRATRVSFTVDGLAVGEQAVTVAPAGEAEVGVRTTLPSRGVLRAVVADEGGYGADDERYMVIDPPARPRLLVVTAGGADRGDAFYIERAMAALEDGGGYDLARRSPDRPPAAADRLDAYAGIVLMGTAGYDRRALDAIGQAVASGTGLIVAPGPSTELARLAGLVGDSGTGRSEAVPALTFAPVDVRHPAFRSFNGASGLLGSVRFSRIVRLSEPRQGRVLARFSDGAPALVERDGSRGRVVIFASDLGNAWNDFALHPAFVPFVHDLVRLVAASPAAAREVRVGERPGPEGARPGVLNLALPGAPASRVAVNVDPSEADAARVTAAAFASEVPRGAEELRTAPASTARAVENEQSLWRYGLMCMLAALIVESAVGRKV